MYSVQSCKNLNETFKNFVYNFEKEKTCKIKEDKEKEKEKEKENEK